MRRGRISAMYIKYLENRITLEKENYLFLDRPIVLEYYMVESEVDCRDELAGKKVYGVGVSKTTDDAYFEESLVYNFSCSFAKTRNAIKMLVRNAVTPVELVPVLENILEMQI